jgi:3'(2'), 5'-bisphosphate nucleotidase
MTIHKDKRIQELEKIIVKAGKEIMNIYALEDRGVSYKQDESPLTIADKKAHEIIFQGLQNLQEAHGFIGEENKNQPYEKRRKTPTHWMVDPLDGTKEFVSRNGEFTVNIALIKEGTPYLGMVFIPVTEELFYAELGSGSWYKKNTRAAPEPIQVNSFLWKDEGLRVLCSRSHLNTATQTMLEQLNKPKKIAAGSALKFLRIAQGKAEVYPRIAPTMEWDTAAAEIILTEAGGQVIQWPSKAKMKYNKEDLTNPHFIAFGAAIDELPFEK